MLGFDQTITAYYSRYNEDAGHDDYFRAVIRGVSWYSQIKAVPAANGLVYDKLYKVRIPNSAESDKVYAAPDLFANPEEQYTLKAATRIVKGEGPPAPKDGTEWAQLLTEHEEAFSVLAYRDNRRIGLKHLYVEGK